MDEKTDDFFADEAFLEVTEGDFFGFLEVLVEVRF